MNEKPSAQEYVRLRPWRITVPKGAPAGRLLSSVLAEHVRHIDPDEWAERIALGGVHLNRRRVVQDVPLSPPSEITYYEVISGLKPVAREHRQVGNEHILYRDEDIAIAVKPAGLPVAPPREQARYCLSARLAELLGREVHLPSRLDTPVGGLVPVSLSARMNRALQRSFENRSVGKRYLFASHCRPDWAGRMVDAPIGFDAGDKRRRAVVSEGGQEALSEFTALGEAECLGQTVHLVLAVPHTGRTHQLRVHAQHAGTPIVGDFFYGGVRSPALHLACVGFAILHPFKNMPLCYALPSALAPEWLRSARIGSGAETKLQELPTELRAELMGGERGAQR